MRVEEIKNIVSNIVYTYEMRLRSLESILETTGRFFEGFQASFLNASQDVDEIKAKVRERLAKDASLRRKDFDNLMRGILSIQIEKERDIKNLLGGCLREQKELASVLGKNLNKLIVALGEGATKNIKESRILITGILAKQDKSRNEAIMKLKEFEREQRGITKSLKELLAKSGALCIEDLKQVFVDLQMKSGKEWFFAAKKVSLGEARSNVF